MSGFFDIPEKDKTKGLNEALDLIENFLDDPDNSKLNRSFGINEPTAVLQGETETQHPTTDEGTQLLNKKPSINWKALGIKLAIVLTAIIVSLMIVEFFIKG